MNADRLLDAFDRLGDEPETVQQFRKVVVGLAMSGKLVAPDEAALPPSGLLEEIEARKRALLQQGTLRKQGPLSSVSFEDLPKGFTNPLNFIRLGEVARIEKGQTGIMKAEPGAYPLVVTAEERGTCDHFDFDGAAAIVPLVSSAGHGKASLQRLHYQEGKFALGSILAAIFPHAPELISARFLFEYLTAFKDELLVSQMIGTANVSLSVGKVADVPVPLVHPLVQRKVDELMALCDRLEAARQTREATRDKLTVASLARLNAPDPETFQADARFALDALPALTARADQIKQLRQAILNLAVRGQLVPQTPSDEPASELLARFATKQAKGRKGRDWSGGLGSQRTPAFNPPQGWCWTTINEIARRVTVGYVGPMRDQYVAKGVPFLRSQNVRANKFREDGMIYISPAFHQKIIKSVLTPGDVVVVRSGNVGTACVIPSTIKEGNCSDLVIVQKPECVVPDFLCFYLNSLAATHVEEGAVGVALTHFNTKSVATMPLALPPLAEQHRIVAKVDELMALCDRLEASLTTADETRRRLLGALLAEALAPVGARELEAAE